ncbi:MAG: gamma-glutamyltransferase [Balneolales bacterium]
MVSLKQKNVCTSFLAISSLIFLLSCGGSKTNPQLNYSIPEQPEISTGYTSKPGWASSEFAVAAANPLATDAGYQILLNGGSAVDAAIAVQLVLTLVEPQSSGIGGGAFLLTWDGSQIQAYNGREKAPSGVDMNLFLDNEGEPLSFANAVHSGLSVGVPGTLYLLKAAHEKEGVLPWENLFQPAITLAEEGFSLSKRLHDQLEEDYALRNDEIARHLYYDENGEAHPVGYTLKNPALAEILRQVAQNGIDSFYQGEIAADMVDRAQSHRRPGFMTEQDLAAYPKHDPMTQVICTDWRAWRLCGFPPPSSGHITIMQMLGMMEWLKAPSSPLQDEVPSAQWMHQYLEAAKLAFADRNLYIGDPVFVEPPAGNWESLLATEYLKERATLISDTSMGMADPGIPGTLSSTYGMHPVQAEMGTSHISIIDADGNAVAMTTTIEQGFGSRIMSDGGTGLPGGFHLNNELTDFSLTPEDEDGNLIANRVEPNKQPRSSMSPTLVFDKETDELVATLGSPGGAAIIHYTAKTIIGMLDWNLNAQEAINLPNFVNYNGPSLLEVNRFPDATISELKARGHEIILQNMTSGLQAIQRTEDGGLFGGADPRREGIVMGK